MNRNLNVSTFLISKYKNVILDNKTLQNVQYIFVLDNLNIILHVVGIMSGEQKAWVHLIMRFSGFLMF